MIRYLPLALFFVLAGCGAERSWTDSAPSPSVLEQDEASCTEKQTLAFREQPYNWRRVNPDCMKVLGYGNDFFVTK